MLETTIKNRMHKAIAALLSAALALSLCPVVPALAEGNTGGSSASNATTMTLGAQYQVSLNDETTEQWFSFTPTKEGPYQFYSSDIAESGGDPKCELGKGNPDDLDEVANDDDGGDGYNFSITCWLTANTTYYLSAQNRSSGTLDYKVQVKSTGNDISYWTATAENLYAYGSKTATLSNLGVKVYIYDDEEEEHYLASSNYQVEGWYYYDSNDNAKKLSSAPSKAGSYFVKLKGKGSYTGTLQRSFHIYNLYDISNWRVSGGAATYDGTRAITYSDLDIELYYYNEDDERVDLNSMYYQFAGWYEDDGEDGYIALSSAPTKKGDYYVKIKGKSPYSGERYISIDIDSVFDINYWNTNCDTFYSDLKTAVTASALNLSLYIWENNAKKTLSSSNYEIEGWYSRTENDDDDDEYTVLEGAPTDAGSYAVKLQGTGEYYGEKFAKFKIADKYDLSNYYATAKSIYSDGKTAVKFSDIALTFTDDNDDDVTFASSVYEFASWMKYDENAEEYDEWGTDANNGPAEAGLYRVKIAGKDPYKGDASASFYLYDTYDLDLYSRSDHTDYCGYGKTITLNDVDCSLYYSNSDGEKVVLDSKYYTFSRWEKLSNGGYYEWETYSTDKNARINGGVYLAVFAPTSAGEVAGYKNEANIYLRVQDLYDLSYWDADDIEASVYQGSAITYADLVSKIASSLHCYKWWSDGKFNFKKADAAKSLAFAGWYKWDRNKDKYVSLGNKPSAGPSTAGSYTVKLKGKAPYSGEVTVDFNLKIIAPAALKKGTKFTVGKNSYKVTTVKKTVAFTGSKSKKASIPATVKYKGVTYKVTSIAAKALKGKKLTKLTVGSNVKSVGKNALKGCKKLKAITLKSGKLTKKSIKALVKGSKVKTIKLSGKAAKKMKAKYKKWLKGTKVKVK